MVSVLDVGLSGFVLSFDWSFCVVNLVKVFYVYFIFFYLIVDGIYEYS